MATFAERVKELRKEKKMTQQELADILHVSMYTVSVWERGVRRPEFNTLDDICKLFNCSLGYLLGETDNDSAAMPATFDEVPMWEGDDDLESLQRACRLFTQLSMTTRMIVTSTIAEAYKIEKQKGMLRNGYDVSLTRFGDPDDTLEVGGEDGLLP
ncbi:MAG: helix-turn-helix domain-containing protein [Oscillospiraceae bacterium]|nr:helix-turn-helix domain-containing protein [Oscillospiraceae bacterium]